MPDPVLFLLASDPRLHIFVKVVVALRVVVAIVDADVVSNLAYGPANVIVVMRVINVANVRRYFGFARGPKNGKDDWSLSTSFQIGLVCVRAEVLKEILVLLLSRRGADHCLLLFT